MRERDGGPTSGLYPPGLGNGEAEVKKGRVTYPMTPSQPWTEMGLPKLCTHKSAAAEWPVPTGTLGPLSGEPKLAWSVSVACHAGRWLERFLLEAFLVTPMSKDLRGWSLLQLEAVDSLHPGWGFKEPQDLNDAEKLIWPPMAQKIYLANSWVQLVTCRGISESWGISLILSEDLGPRGTL